LVIARAVFLFGEGILRLFWVASACQRSFSRAKAVAKGDEWRSLCGGERSLCGGEGAKGCFAGAKIGKERRCPTLLKKENVEQRD